MCCGAQEKTDVHCRVKWRGQGSRTLFLRASVPLFLSTCLAPRPEGRDKETAAVSHHVGQTFLKFCRHQIDSVSLSSFSSCLSFVCMNQWERCLCTPFALRLGVWSEMMNQLRELQPHSGKIRKIASSRKFEKRGSNKCPPSVQKMWRFWWEDVAINYPTSGLSKIPKINITYSGTLVKKTSGFY